MSELGGGGFGGEGGGKSGGETGSISGGEIGSVSGGEIGGETGNKAGEVSTGSDVGTAFDVGTGEVSPKAPELDAGKELTETEEKTLPEELLTQDEMDLLNAKKFHQQSVNQILATNGEFFSEANRERFENNTDVLTVVPFNPDTGLFGSTEFRDGKNYITVTKKDMEQMERTIKHETNHAASYHAESVTLKPESDTAVYKQTVGFRNTTRIQSISKGEVLDVQTTGRGLNEGTTTMFTNAQLSELSPEKGEAAQREAIYSATTELCQQLQDIVGKEPIAKSYYGAEPKALETAMDRLGGEGTFEAFQKSLDQTMTSDRVKAIQGMQEAQELLAKLSEAKKGGNTQ